MIDNPEYEHIPDVYKLPPLKFVGFELWQARQLNCHSMEEMTNTSDQGCLPTRLCHYRAGMLQLLSHAHPMQMKSASNRRMPILEQRRYN